MVKIHKRVFGPQILAKLFPSYQFACVLEQDVKNLKCLTVQRDLDSILPQFLGL